jgi:hypothetical protein
VDGRDRGSSADAPPKETVLAAAVFTVAALALGFVLEWNGRRHQSDAAAPSLRKWTTGRIGRYMKGFFRLIKECVAVVGSLVGWLLNSLPKSPNGARPA